jgi:hypothetical protein
LAVSIGVAVMVIGGNLYAGFRSVFFLIGFIPLVIFGLWMRRTYPPVREWRETWLKEHEIRTKEDSP